VTQHLQKQRTLYQSVAPMRIPPDQGDPYKYLFLFSISQLPQNPHSVWYSFKEGYTILSTNWREPSVLHFRSLLKYIYCHLDHQFTLHICVWQPGNSTINCQYR